LGNLQFMSEDVGIVDVGVFAMMLLDVVDELPELLLITLIITQLIPTT
jgi:hypothetical protein